MSETHVESKFKKTVYIFKVHSLKVLPAIAVNTSLKVSVGAVI